MKEVKYIPGDLVMYQGKVTTVRECRGNYYVLNCQHSIEDAVCYTDLKPVQLTPKILKKNGWERNGGDSYLKYSLYRVFLMFVMSIHSSIMRAQPPNISISFQKILNVATKAI